jgi:hypothetical protein
MLYELSIGLSYVVYRRKQRAALAEQSPEETHA